MTLFIETLAPFAIKYGTAANVLPSLILAQGVLESGSGTSSLAKNANNLFGIKKGSNWDGETYAVVTSEYTPEGKYYEVVAEFRKYPSYEGAVIDLVSKYSSGLLGESRNRYEAVLGQQDFALAAQAVKDAGYATDPLYPQKLISIYNLYNLSQYDANNISDIVDIIVENEEETEMAFKIAIDAGHGLNTAGKRTPAGEREWTFNNLVALAAIAELNTYSNVQILRVDDPTGKTDVSLNARAAKANAWGADVYISIHHNANTGKWGTWSGVETFVMEGTSSNANAMKLAKAVHPRLVSAMGIKDRGVKAANFAVLRQTRMPAILTEGGYMDSSIDIIKMRNKTIMNNQGKSIATGVALYLGAQKKAGSVAAKPTPVVKPVVKPATSDLFRVRKAWTDAASQIGAFADLQGAIDAAKAKSGYKVFDNKGKQVYPIVVVAPPKPAAPVADKLFRVRKSWTDSDSQLGAFSDLVGAKEAADKNLSHKVFDGTGRMVYDPKEAADKMAADAKANELAASKARYEAEYKLAIDLGITDGSNPDGPATREQVAVMIVRALNLKK